MVVARPAGDYHSLSVKGMVWLTRPKTATRVRQPCEGLANTFGPMRGGYLSTGPGHDARIRTMDYFDIESLREAANAVDFADPDWREREIEKAAVQFGRHVVAFIGHDKPWGSVGRVSIQRFRLDAPCVYFIGGGVGGIKIGMSKAPLERLTVFQFNSPIPLKIMALTTGGRAQEQLYHKSFATLRLHGEWFDRHPDILAEIDRLAHISANGLQFAVKTGGQV